ncbi:hypothetical protein [Chitinophaga flava]|nr:hypothetical protein [Chitinophaga flava]
MPNKLLPMYPMKNRYLFPISFLAIVACHETKTPVESTDAAPPAQEAAKAGNATTASNTLQITEPCAVFYSPDSIKLEKIKKENGEEAFYTITDDNLNYFADSNIFLESKGVKTVTAQKGKISFTSKDGKTTTINLNDEKYTWEVFLFNGKTVTNADISDIENEYEKYMKP